jgi:hypothetical protein
MNRVDDGFSTTITFADNPTVKFYEKGVTPPSIEGGGANDTTTMLNTTWRTRAPKKLKTLGEMSMTAAYDPEVYDDIVGMINNNQLVTVNFPDGETLAFYGWVDNFAPGEIVEGEQPEAEVTIICSNQNDSGVETPPTFSPTTTT